MNAVRKAYFFLVGAPKSGTTSFYFYLKDHPQLFMPRRKELNCFCRDLHFQYPLLTEKQFIAYYDDCEPEKKAGDATVWNLLSSEAAKNIHAFNAQAQIIILLRNPAEVIQSLHANHIFNRNENIPDLEKALDEIRERKAGKNIPSNLKSPVESLFYYDVVDYAKQVARYFDVFGRNRVKIILFDEFISNPAVVYSGLLEFLGVSKNFKPEFRKYNERKSFRSPWMSRFISHPPPPVKKIGRLILPHQSARRDKTMQRLWELNTKKVQASSVHPALLKKMMLQIEPQVKELEELLQAELPSWRSPSADW